MRKKFYNYLLILLDTQLFYWHLSPFSLGSQQLYETRSNVGLPFISMGPTKHTWTRTAGSGTRTIYPGTTGSPGLGRREDTSDTINGLPSSCWDKPSCFTCQPWCGMDSIAKRGWMLIIF